MCIFSVYFVIKNMSLFLFFHHYSLKALQNATVAETNHVKYNIYAAEIHIQPVLVADMVSLSHRRNVTPLYHSPSVLTVP